ncbi:ferric-dicitrate binding protein FerR (iron transport regulator) [Dyadobacter jejuensis]|uniref:Ferric-dicitrate binding protein FerR (Iron transport regulator) n=1 Tax=Dyadobacter jejuensis TaxID=1082580 RepID=A0A316AK16_9BACT|nr:FecR family protein [Dyadobacter jejuensis]PWJ57941.1 ferric-dicitrate binding protein FerR (iron transport regulator) [Dyadobacter jejuensis]
MQRDFSKFEIEDFVFDESFQKWASGIPSPEHRFWERYLHIYPHQTDKLLAARELVKQLKADDPALSFHAMRREVWSTLQEHIEPSGKVVRPIFTFWNIAASVVLVILGLGAWYLSSQPQLHQQMEQVITFQPAESELIEEVNRTNSTLLVHLSDGSVVELAKNSRLKYPKSFANNQRVVQLEGEAFFEVQKNPESPFLIYANETVTKVLGTSFRIVAFQDASKVIVSVATGKVSVFSKEGYHRSAQHQNAAGVVLTANQRAEFTRDQQQFNKTLVENPDIIITQENPTFNFDNTPLKLVFEALEKAYGVEILYDAELVLNRSLKVHFGEESLYEKLTVICNTMGMQYQIVDAKIIIERKNLN